MAKVAAVILNFNGIHFLKELLPSIIRHSSLATVYVADNASTDGSVNYIKSTYNKEVKLIELDQNYGFCGGYNRALRHIEADYYAIINSDLEVTEDWLEELVNFLEKNPGVAAVQPKILDYKNREYFEYAGAAGGMIDKWGYPFCRGRLFFHLEKDEGQYDQPQRIFWATGACMVVRSKLFHEQNGFDEVFFAHLEEIDLCWRLQHAGYSVFCVPSSKVYHIGGGTLPKDNPRKTFLNFRNSLLAIYKNSERARLLLTMRLLLDSIAAVKFFIQRQFKDAIAVYKAYANFLVLKKQVDKTANKKPLDAIYGRSIVFQYFLKKIRKYKELT